MYQSEETRQREEEFRLRGEERERSLRASVSLTQGTQLHHQDRSPEEIAEIKAKLDRVNSGDEDVRNCQYLWIGVFQATSVPVC